MNNDTPYSLLREIIDAYTSLTPANVWQGLIDRAMVVVKRPLEPPEPNQPEIAVYRGHLAPVGRSWFLRITIDHQSFETPIYKSQAERMISSGVRQLADGSGL